jgi:hypothetical protein
METKTVIIEVSGLGRAWSEKYSGERALWKARRVARLLKRAGYTVVEVA